MTTPDEQKRSARTSSPSSLSDVDRLEQAVDSLIEIAHRNIAAEYGTATQRGKTWRLYHNLRHTASGDLALREVTAPLVESGQMTRERVAALRLWFAGHDAFHTGARDGSDEEASIARMLRLMRSHNERSGRDAHKFTAADEGDMRHKIESTKVTIDENGKVVHGINELSSWEEKLFSDVDMSVAGRDGADQGLYLFWESRIDQGKMATPDDIEDFHRMLERDKDLPDLIDDFGTGIDRQVHFARTFKFKTNQASGLWEPQQRANTAKWEELRDRFRSHEPSRALNIAEVMIEARRHAAEVAEKAGWNLDEIATRVPTTLERPSIRVARRPLRLDVDSTASSAATDRSVAPSILGRPIGATSDLGDSDLEMRDLRASPDRSATDQTVETNHRLGSDDRDKGFGDSGPIGQEM